MAFQSFSSGYYALPDMWVGPFPRVNMAGSPGISSAITGVPDTCTITIAPADTQSSVFYTLNGTDPRPIDAICSAVRGSSCG